MDLESLFLPIISALDITTGLNFKVVGLIALLTLLGEATIQIPLLIEAIWMLVGYQLRLSNSASMLNLSITFLAAQVSRQIGIAALYFLYYVINTPLSKLYMKYLNKNKYYRKYSENDYLYNMRFLSLSSATLGMMTPLNAPIKIMLIIKRKLKILLLGTLYSGMLFDVIYIAAGAIFQTTTLQVYYMPLFFLIGFGVLVFFRTRIMR